MKTSFIIACAAITLMACTGKSVSQKAGDDADSTAVATNAEPQVNMQVYIVGTMEDNQCQIELALQSDNDFHCAGYVLYPESEPMLVAGSWDCFYGDDGSGEYHNIRLTEYQADGTITGRFIINLECSGDDEGFTFSDAERTYISHSEDEENTTAPIVDVMTCKSEMPDWFPESPFIPANYDDISTHYFYELYGPDAYGEVLIEKVGDGKFTFHAEDVLDDSYFVNEMKNEEDRPAQMQGNTFKYENVNDCGYTLQGFFYKKFLILDTQQAPSDKNPCSNIDAYFIRQEQ